MTGAGSAGVRTEGGCRLCTFVRDRDPERTILADEVLVVMEPDVAPTIDVKVVPVAHIERITDLPAPEMSILLARLRQVLSAVEAVCASDDVQLVPDNGPEGGHVAFHIAATTGSGGRHGYGEEIGRRITESIHRMAGR